MREGIRGNAGNAEKCDGAENADMWGNADRVIFLSWRNKYIVEVLVRMGGNAETKSAERRK